MRRRLDQAARCWALASLVCWLGMLAFTLGIAADADAAGVAMNPNQAAPELEQKRAQPQTTVDEVSREVMCPSCDTTLDQSDSPAAQRMRAWVIAAVDAGWTEEEIRDGLVEEYGGDESVLATPRAEGAALALWLVPAIIALAAVSGGLLMLRSWRRDAQTRSGSSSSFQAASGSGSAANSSVQPSASPSPPSPPSSR